MTVGPKPGKPAWPLYLVAALAYIPLLGFFLGSVAVTWGLVSSRPHARRAAVIAATGALLNVLLVVLAIVVPGPGRVAFQQENRNAVEESLGEILAALEAHHAATHAYPASLKALQRARGPLHALPIYDFSAGVLRFRPFQYVVSDDGTSYDLFSVGPDGEPGTDDDIRPLLPDSLRGRTGLRPVHD